MSLLQRLRKITALAVCISLFVTQTGFAQIIPPSAVLPEASSARFRPARLTYIGFEPSDGSFDLILDKGDERGLAQAALSRTADELMRYFYTGLVVPDKAFRVDLRPDTAEGMIDRILENTDAGRILLEADVRLKKDTAALTSPDTPEGRRYWDRLYARAHELFGTGNIDIPTLVRPWIVPGEVILRQTPNGVCVYKASLKVELEQDRLKDSAAYRFDDPKLRQLNVYACSLMRELILPKLTKEVNSGRAYAPLRQLFCSLVLAQWFKKQACTGALDAGRTAARIDSGDMTGLRSAVPWAKEDYYAAYKHSFDSSEYARRERVYAGGDNAVRTYCSGGISLAAAAEGLTFHGSAVPALTRGSVRLHSSRDGGFALQDDFSFPFVRQGAYASESLDLAVRVLNQGMSIDTVPMMAVTATLPYDWEMMGPAESRFFQFFPEYEHGSLYVVAKYGLDSIERDATFSMRRELMSFMNAFFSARIPGKVVIEVLNAVHKSLFDPAAPDRECLKRLFVNSQRRFERTVADYFAGIPYDWQSNPLGSTDYSHVKLFSYIYFQEIRELQRILRERPGETVTVLDLGTGFANVLFTMRAFLSPADLARVRFFGIDAQTRDMSIAAEYNDEHDLGILFKQVNVEDADWMEQAKSLNGGRRFDLVLANHVLEHLDPSSEPEKYVREWGILGKTVAVAVPMDETEESHTISGHTFWFDVPRLRQMKQNFAREEISVDLVAPESGIMMVHIPEAGETARHDGGQLTLAGLRFGTGTVERIREVYGRSWGKDAYRIKGEPEKGAKVDADGILDALNQIHERGARFEYIAAELAGALKYSEGMTDEHGYTQPVRPAQLLEVAQLWGETYDQIDGRGMNLPESFRDLWAEYTVFLSLRRNAEYLSGKAGVDSYSGATDKERAGRAFAQYEMADLVGLKSVNALMRISAGQIRRMCDAGDWLKVAGLAAAARLYGEGRFVSLLGTYLDRMSGAFRREFDATVSVFLENIEKGYRDGVLAYEIDAEAVDAQARRLSSLAAQTAPAPEYDAETALIERRQAGLRDAERHLENVERSFRGGAVPAADRTDPPALYAEAGTVFLAQLNEVFAGRMELGQALDIYRRRLETARSAADRAYGNRYYWCAGYGESTVQMKARANNPREKLYSMEAYCERIFFSAVAAGRRAQEEGLPLTRGLFDAAYNSSAAAYVQEWINYFGPRRGGIFGFDPAAEGLNRATADLDSAVRRIVTRARERGAREELWGWMYCGFTDRLRSMLASGKITEEEALGLLEREGASGLESRLLSLSGEDAQVVVGVHVRNADIDVLRETLSHAAETGWREDAKWVLLGSNTTDIRLGERERELALELGITRYALCADRHLKAGNQNRIIPNVPISQEKETYYLTLDDDYCPASGMLQRIVPMMQANRRIPFVQVPLYFRANSELGFSRARKLDASIVYSSMPLFFLGLNDLGKGESLVTPFGTGTVYRLTPGKSMFEETGYFPLGTSAEDTACGVIHYLKSRLDIYAEKPADTGDGVYLNEMWVRGDSIDYEGRLRQQIRWAEGSMRVFLLAASHVVKSVFMTGGTGRLRLKTLLHGLFTYTYYAQMSFTFLCTSVALPLAMLAFGLPAAAAPFFIISGLASLAAVAVNMLTYHYAKISVRESLDTTALHLYGAGFNMARGVFRSVLGEPQGWFANKKAATSYLTKCNLVNLGAAALNVAAFVRVALTSTPAAMFGALPVWMLLNAGIFVYLFLLQRAPPGGYAQKMQRMREQFRQERHMFGLGGPGYKEDAKYTFHRAFVTGTTVAMAAIGLSAAVGGLIWGAGVTGSIVLLEACVYMAGMVFSGLTTRRALKAMAKQNGDAQYGDVSKRDRLDIADTRDGGVSENVGGVDFSASLAEARAAAPGERLAQTDAAALRALPADLGREWSKIKLQIVRGDVPYGEIEQYIMACRSREDGSKSIDEADAYIRAMLSKEEQDGVTSSPGMMAVLSSLP